VGSRAGPGRGRPGKGPAGSSAAALAGGAASAATSKEAVAAPKKKEKVGGVALEKEKVKGEKMGGFNVE